MKHVSLALLATCFTLYIDAAQQAAVQAPSIAGCQASSSQSVSQSTPAVRARIINPEELTVEVSSEVESKASDELRELRQMNLQLAERIRQLEDHRPSIPGLNNVRAFPAHIIPFIMPFNCLRHAALLRREVKGQNLSQQGNEFIASARRVGKNGATPIVIERGNLPDFENGEILILVSNRGNVFFKGSSMLEQAVSGLSRTRDELLYDVCANLFHLPLTLELEPHPDVVTAFKQIIAKSDFFSAQKNSLCCNYFDKSLTEIEVELKMKPSVILEQIGDSPDTKTSFYQRHKVACWVGGGLVIFATGGFAGYALAGKWVAIKTAALATKTAICALKGALGTKAAVTAAAATI